MEDLDFFIAFSKASSALSQTSSDPALTSGRVDNLISKLSNPKVE